MSGLSLAVKSGSSAQSGDVVGIENPAKRQKAINIIPEDSENIELAISSIDILIKEKEDLKAKLDKEIIELRRAKEEMIAARDVASIWVLTHEKVMKSQKDFWTAATLKARAIILNPNYYAKHKQMFPLTLRNYIASSVNETRDYLKSITLKDLMPELLMTISGVSTFEILVRTDALSIAVDEIIKKFRHLQDVLKKTEFADALFNKIKYTNFNRTFETNYSPISAFRELQLSILWGYTVEGSRDKKPLPQQFKATVAWVESSLPSISSTSSSSSAHQSGSSTASSSSAAASLISPQYNLSVEQSPALTAAVAPPMSPPLVSLDDPHQEIESFLGLS